MRPCKHILCVCESSETRSRGWPSCLHAAGACPVDAALVPRHRLDSLEAQIRQLSHSRFHVAIAYHILDAWTCGAGLNAMR